MLLRHGGVLRGGAEPGADRDGGDGEQRDGAFQRDDAAQRGEPGAGEPQQAERPLAVGEPGRDARGERAAGDRQADQDHRVRELLVGVVARIILRYYFAAVFCAFASVSPACSRRAAALSVASHVKSRSERPKCP